MISVQRFCALFAGLVAFFSISLAADIPSHARVLSDEDVERYTAIFAAQERGNWSEADGLISSLESQVLLGYVLEQRYMHPTAYRSSYRELSRWLRAYADHPNARPIHRLARQRQQGAAAPRRPTGRRWRTAESSNLHPDLLAEYETSARRDDVPAIERRLRYLTREGRPTEALNYLMAPRQFNALTAAQTDRARGWIAASFYFDGDLTRAKRIADQATRRSPESAVLSYWIAGLVAYRRDDLAEAYANFSAQADIPYQDDDLRAAAAFWAARTALAGDAPEHVLTYLNRTAEYPFTFYGQLGLAQLGQNSGVFWGQSPIRERDIDALAEHSPRIRRAIALTQVGRVSDAEEEVKWAHGEIPADEDAALIALASTLQLPSAQLMLAQSAQDRGHDHPRLSESLYPLPNFAPSNGFEIDQAVLFGLMRQESKFLPQAESDVGARGLMQLMPRTASYVARNDDIAPTHASSRLYDPAYNMQLGQSYVEQLLTRYNHGEGDLIEMALSYNWGPGNYQRFEARSGITDQLLLIESVPNSEARHFVETVLTNIWVYRDRLGEPAPSRDALAAGARPIYQSVGANSEISR